jgi:hypothetical protein
MGQMPRIRATEDRVTAMSARSVSGDLAGCEPVNPLSGVNRSTALTRNGAVD